MAIDKIQHDYDFLTRKEPEQQVDQDENKVVIIGGKIALEAVEDKILLLNDKFRTGNECKDCDGNGKIEQCLCRRSGYPLGTNRLGGNCSMCGGTPEIVEGKECLTCRGTGMRPGAIIIPESSKTVPTSGVVVSIGPLCNKVKLGERYLYGAHTGYNLPFKGNVRLRLLREHEVMCKMYAIDPDASLEDFKLLEEPIDNMSGIR